MGAKQAHGDEASLIAADPDRQVAETVGLGEQHDVVTGGIADPAYVVTRMSRNSCWAAVDMATLLDHKAAGAARIEVSVLSRVR